MKTFTKFLTMLAVAALFATGCVNEEPVKNRTSVTFSITKFVEILLEIPGEHNFVLDVTDNDNVLTHKTVKLIVH